MVGEMEQMTAVRKAVGKAHLRVDQLADQWVHHWDKSMVEYLEVRSVSSMVQWLVGQTAVRREFQKVEQKATLRVQLKVQQKVSSKDKQKDRSKGNLTESSMVALMADWTAD